MRSGAAERGNSSYQAPWRARSRAASSRYSPEATAPRRRSGCAVIRASSSGDVVSAPAGTPRRRSWAAARFSVSASSAAPAARARRTAPPTSAAPSCSSSSTSWPAASRFSRSERHVAHESIQPSTRNAVHPRLPDRHLGAPVVVPEGNHRELAARRPLRDGSARARAGRSCPSVNTSASIGTTSPTEVFAGKRPPSTAGETCSITTLVSCVPVVRLLVRPVATRIQVPGQLRMGGWTHAPVRDGFRVPRVGTRRLRPCADGARSRRERAGLLAREPVVAGLHARIAGAHDEADVRRRRVSDRSGAPRDPHRSELDPGVPGAARRTSASFG